MAITGDDYNGYPALASASGGVATVNALSHISLTAAGAVNINAGAGALQIHGTYGGAYSAEALAKNKGVATLNVDGSVTVKGSAVTLSAGSDMDIKGESYDGYNDLASAASAGAATINAKNGVTVTATAGAVKATARNDMSIGIDDYIGDLSKTKADGALSKATATADTSINFSGKTISLAGSSMDINGGYRAGYSASVSAKDHGKATQTDIATVNFTAANGFSAVLTGAGSSNELSIHGDASTAVKAKLHGSSAGAATLGANDGVNIKVTAAGGTISIKTGSQLKSQLSIYAGSKVGYSASVHADAGTATLTADGSVNLSALGAVTIADSHGSLSIYAGNSEGAHALAEGSNDGNAKVAANGSLNIKGGNVTFTAGNTMEVYGGYDNVGVHALASGEQGVGTVTIDARNNITATGNFTAFAGESMYFYAGALSNAASAAARADDGGGAKATLTSQTDLNVKAGGSINLKTGAGYLYIYGNSNDAGLKADASAGSHATATLTATGNVNFTAGGNFTAAAGSSDLYIFGGHNVDHSANVFAAGAAGVAKLTTQANVTITAKGAVSLTAGSGSDDTAFIYARNSQGGSVGGHAHVTGSTAGIASLDAEGTVKVNAGGALTIGGYNAQFSAGDKAGSAAVIKGMTGTATETANASISLTAGTTLTTTLQGGNLNIDGGSVGGRNALISGTGAHAKATLTDTQTVSLTAAGAFKVTGADDINILAGAFAATGTDAVVVLFSADQATASVNSGITIKGSSLSVTHTGTLTKTPVTGLNVAGLTETGTLSILGGHILNFAPLSLGTVQQDALVMSLETMLGTSAQTQQPTLFTPAASLQTGSVGCGVTLLEQGGHCLLK
jgi:hypothetical protein